MTKVLKKHEADINERFGFKIEDVGVHSWRKGAHTHMNCGSTAGPSAAATCIRGGHSIGSTRDVYVCQEKASDEYCGRLLAGLPVERAEFAASYPDFKPIDLEECLKNGVSETDISVKQSEVDKEVVAALESIFTRENLDHFPTLMPFLRCGLASHLHHREALEASYPANATVRFTPLFTSKTVADLAKHVRIAMPWDDTYKYFARATGLPPHVMHFAYFEKINKNITSLIPAFEDMLDRRQFNGQISLDQMRNLIVQSDTFQNMASDIANIRAGIANGSGLSAGSSNSDGTVGGAIRFDLHDHSDGVRRRVPPTWTFPHVSLMNIYKYWYCGDEVHRISPMRDFEPVDVGFLKGRAKMNLADVRYICRIIDEEAVRKGHAPRRFMSLIDVGSCFHAGKSALGIPTKTPTGKNRNLALMKWSSALRYMENKNRNPDN